MKKVDMKLVAMYKDDDSYLMLLYDRKNNKVIIGLENETHFHSFIVDKDGIGHFIDRLKIVQDLMERV